MSILFTICGRAGSKGIKNKNIRNFVGYPLPMYVLAAIDLYLRRNPEIDADIVVNSDSKELVTMVKNNVFRKVEEAERKEELSGDLVPKMDVIRDCLKQMESRNQKNYEMVIDLDISSPLRTIADVENLINKKKETGCDVAFSVTDSRRNPYFNMVKKVEKGYKRVLESNFTARQEAPEMFDMNAAMYAYDPDYLRTGKGILEGYCEVIKMYDTGLLDLDNESEFELMEVIARYLFEKREDFGEIYKHLAIN